MASRIILDPETLLAQAGEMQSLTAEYESLFSKVTGTLNDTNNNWSELLAHNFAGKISSAQQSFASITESFLPVGRQQRKTVLQPCSR